FLGAGSVIHAMSDEQDIQKMGGLWDKVPITAKTFLVATLAIAGIPPLAGFFSKDEILGRAFERHPALWIVGFITAAMTAFYMFPSTLQLPPSGWPTSSIAPSDLRLKSWLEKWVLFTNCSSVSIMWTRFTMLSL